MLAWNDAVREQPLDVITAVTAGRQADVVHYDQIDVSSGGPCVEIRRIDSAHPAEPTIVAPRNVQHARHARMRVT